MNDTYSSQIWVSQQQTILFFIDTEYKQELWLIFIPIYFYLIFLFIKDNFILHLYLFLAQLKHIPVPDLLSSLLSFCFIDELVHCYYIINSLIFSSVHTHANLSLLISKKRETKNVLSGIIVRSNQKVARELISSWLEACTPQEGE